MDINSTDSCFPFLGGKAPSSVHTLRLLDQATFPAVFPAPPPPESWSPKHFAPHPPASAESAPAAPGRRWQPASEKASSPPPEAAPRPATTRPRPAMKIPDG